jgi:GNAT superfamily N-acetyltransferase
VISLSALDLDRFGVVTARAPLVTASDVDPAVTFCRSNRVRLLIARCNTEDLGAAQNLEASGARLMDTLVYFARSVDPREPEPTPPVPVRLHREGEAEEIQRIAADAFRGYTGHYHADPRLDRAACDAVYASWAHRSCLDAAVADRVLVAELEGRLVGFLTLKARAPGEQEIVLNAVSPQAQRHGVYRSLVLGAIAQVRAEGATRVIVSTQVTNVAVQRIWTRLGFEPDHSFYTFHLWLDPA